MKLYNGDCLEIMKDIPDKSIDLILCDLPYGTTWNEWDSIINIKELFLEYKRLIKDVGNIVLFSAEPFTSQLIYNNLDLYKYSQIWVKNKAVNFLNCHYQPMRSYEDICVFSLGGVSAQDKNKAIYNPQGLIKYNKNYKRGTSTNYCSYGAESFQEFTNYPDNILYYDKDIERYHPTQKPVKLLENLIRTYSNKGDLVLDNTCGSGSTGVAAVNTQRDFIGIEKNPHYFEIAQKRIKDAQAQGLFDFE